jgi:hypothetical protein
LPFAVDVQNKEVAGTERCAFDGKAALFVLCEPVRDRRECSEAIATMRYHIPEVFLKG